MISQRRGYEHDPQVASNVLDAFSDYALKVGALKKMEDLLQEARDQFGQVWDGHNRSLWTARRIATRAVRVAVLDHQQERMKSDFLTWLVHRLEGEQDFLDNHIVWARLVVIDPEDVDITWQKKLHHRMTEEFLRHHGAVSTLLSPSAAGAIETPTEVSGVLLKIHLVQNELVIVGDGDLEYSINGVVSDSGVPNVFLDTYLASP